jgi:Domain of unknown function (DUF892)
MPTQDKGLEDLFHETLKDIYMAEKRILTALPKMASRGVQWWTGTFVLQRSSNHSDVVKKSE